MTILITLNDIVNSAKRRMQDRAGGYAHLRGAKTIRVGPSAPVRFNVRRLPEIT